MREPWERALKIVVVRRRLYVPRLFHTGGSSFVQFAAHSNSSIHTRLRDNAQVSPCCYHYYFYYRTIVIALYKRSACLCCLMLLFQLIESSALHDTQQQLIH
jgi:hypothetical protein